MKRRGRTFETYKEGRGEEVHLQLKAKGIPSLRGDFNEIFRLILISNCNPLATMLSVVSVS